ncbi:MAG: transcriptional regulator [Bacteroidales bacterium]|nr:transcriptional regulator [Bacteroidales bacterium]
MSQKIASSTGEIDKRTTNGNNGTSRGEDKKPRKRPSGYYVLKDEVKAGLKARLEIISKCFESKADMARKLRVSTQVVDQWFKRGLISVDGAYKMHKYMKRTGLGHRASFCRPDIKFDSNGKPLHKRCQDRRMMRVVTDKELKMKPIEKNWRQKKKEKGMKKIQEKEAREHWMNAFSDIEHE